MGHYTINVFILLSNHMRGLCGHDDIVVGFTTTYAISAYHVNSKPTHGKVYLIQHYVIKFVSDFRQVSGFFWALWFPPPIKLTSTL